MCVKVDMCWSRIDRLEREERRLCSVSAGEGVMLRYFGGGGGCAVFSSGRGWV